MNLKRKKIALLFSGILTATITTSLVVACTENNENKTINETQSVSLQTAKLESMDSKSFKPNNKKEHHLVLIVKNANKKYIQVVLTSKIANNKFFSVTSSKALVVNDKADVVFRNIDKTKTFKLEKVMVFDGLNSAENNEVNIPSTLKQQELKDRSELEKPAVFVEIKKQDKKEEKVEDKLKEKTDQIKPQDQKGDEELNKQKQPKEDASKQENKKEEITQQDPQNQGPKVEKTEPTKKDAEEKTQAQAIDKKEEGSSSEEKKIGEIKPSEPEPQAQPEEQNTPKSEPLIKEQEEQKNGQGQGQKDESSKTQEANNGGNTSEQENEKTKEKDPLENKESDPDPNTQEITKQEDPETKKPTLSSDVQWSSLRVAHWNVQHQSGKDQDKNEALARIILKHKFDVVGLTEIMPVKDGMTSEEKEQAVKRVVDLMNEFSNTTNYEYLISDNLEGRENKITESTFHTSTERIGVIYNKEKVHPIPFANGNIGHIYSNKPGHGIWTQKDVDYSRPPFSVKMQSVGKVTNDFTLIFAHFDSPGYRKGKKQEKNYSKKALRDLGVERILKDIEKPGKFLENDQGSRELDDAENIVKVIKEVKKIDEDKDDDFFFLGDTNIKLGNEHFAFKSLRKEGFENLLKDDYEHKTSLSTITNKMANPYDKIFKNSNLETRDAKLFNLWKVFEEQILNDEWYQKVKKTKGSKWPKTEPKEKAAKTISDHSPTWFDLVLNPDDKK
ncbi:endonuclease/exonuclease/phosphatase family protein [Ureaplasma diversum]|uniref:endonuclease/exonuclease/phosphatase family protein n=1 Tax=Ureaplasma diversum TaxID=42094 RepID=UPI000AC37C28|nr:endonuclease/exonuclease/phosphatase family protein [Ureaplasma diversum]